MKFGVVNKDCTLKKNKDAPVCKIKKKFNDAPGSKHRKIAGISIAGFGLLLASPPGLFPDDFLDLFVAGLITTLTGIPALPSLLLTYTLVAWSVFVLGAFIFPGKTKEIITGVATEVWGGIKDIKKPRNMILFGASILTMTVVLTLYSDYIAGSGLL